MRTDTKHINISLFDRTNQETGERLSITALDLFTVQHKKEWTFEDRYETILIQAVREGEVIYLCKYEVTKHTQVLNTLIYKCVLD